jgi:hypothetical protein
VHPFYTPPSLASQWNENLHPDRTLDGCSTHSLWSRYQDVPSTSIPAPSRWHCCLCVPPLFKTSDSLNSFFPRQLPATYLLIRSDCSSLTSLLTNSRLDAPFAEHFHAALPSSPAATPLRLTFGNLKDPDQTLISSRHTIVPTDHAALTRYNSAIQIVARFSYIIPIGCTLKIPSQRG